MDEKELLKYAVDSGILDIALVQKQVTMQKRENPLLFFREIGIFFDLFKFWLNEFCKFHKPFLLILLIDI